MSSIYLTDSGTPIINRAVELLEEGTIRGVILTPFASPRLPDLTTRGGRARQDALRCVQEIAPKGGHILFDAQTHVVGFPGANMFTKYNSWDLWPHHRGDLSTGALQQGHVDRVVAAQSALGVETLAPTVRLEQPTGHQAQIAIDLSRRTLDIQANAWLTVAGTSSFWATGSALDSHIGSLAQLRPSGFMLVVARPAIGCPAPGVSPEEVAGLCRTVHSLSLRVPIIVSHGDLAALPTIAAGAIGLGSGWDLRQRVLGGDAFQISTTIRRRGSRVTYRGLLSVLKRREAEALRVQDSQLSERLVPGALPISQNAEWQHHLTVLEAVAGRIAGRPAGRPRVDELRRLYAAANADFRPVESAVRRLEYGRHDWLDAVMKGLELYAIGEGW